MFRHDCLPHKILRKTYQTERRGLDVLLPVGRNKTKPLGRILWASVIHGLSLEMPAYFERKYRQNEPQYNLADECLPPAAGLNPWLRDCKQGSNFDNKASTVLTQKTEMLLKVVLLLGHYLAEIKVNHHHTLAKTLPHKPSNHSNPMLCLRWTYGWVHE